MDLRTVPGLWRVEHHDEIASTQDAALAAARNGERGPLAILAHRQTAGRGRGGRAWAAPAGNLNFSALLRPDNENLQPAAWSLLAGVAVFEAAACFAPAAGLMLKWPNDLLLDGGKLGGVLIDCALRADGKVDWVVIGVGVNLVAAPKLADRATSCLADVAPPVPAEDVARLLMAEIDRWRAAGFAAVRAAWLARAHKVGTRLRVRWAEDFVEGAFLGLTEDGRLILEGAGAIVSGEAEILPQDEAVLKKRMGSGA